MALAQGGELYAWGINKDGQLGVGDQKDRVSPCPVVFRDQSKPPKVTAITCGGKHTMALSQVGNLTVGLGMSSQVDPHYASGAFGVVPDRGLKLTLTRPQQAAQAYVWGCNKFGQLGLGDKVARNVPTHLAAFRNRRLLQVRSHWKKRPRIEPKKGLGVCSHFFSLRI